MVTITTYTNQLYADGMQLSGQSAYNNEPIGQLLANASWATSAAVIVMAQTVPSWVVASQIVYDITSGAKIGTVSSTSNNTLTLTANMASVSTGAADVLQFGFTPSDLSVGAAAGADIRGLVQLMRLHAAEIKAIATYVQTDIITSGQDAAANAILTNIINNC